MKHSRTGLPCMLLSVLILGLLLTACTSGGDAGIPAEPSESSGLGETLGPQTSVTEWKAEQVSVYIGTAAGGFTAYPAEIQGEVTADALIGAIAEQTGWNLTLADPVSSGKGGMAVSFSSGCAIFTGPPQPQKEDFFVYDNVSLAQMILDSVQETLRRYFVVEPGDPASLDIWFSVEDRPIEIENLIVPMDRPWENQFAVK